VHFLDAWRALAPLDLPRLAIPAALLLLAVLVPGRLMARLAAFGLALSVLLLRELDAGPWIAWGWALLWLAIAWLAGRPGPRSRSARLAGLESGGIGLVLGPALLALLLAGVAQLDLDAGMTRRCSYGVLLVCLGFLHLMMRRHVERAATGFAAMGLGLQVLLAAARAGVAGGSPPGAVTSADGLPPAGLPLAAAALAVALAARIGAARMAAAGSAWVSDAHDLHD
jgi:hypothetical protein